VIGRIGLLAKSKGYYLTSTMRTCGGATVDYIGELARLFGGRDGSWGWVMLIGSPLQRNLLAGSLDDSGHG